mgnify:CR=1 FL=1
MDKLDMAKIFAEQQAAPKETATTTTVTAMATSDSADGTVYVDMGGVTISGDDSQSVPIATTVAVKKGDIVRVELLGADGKAKTPTVTGVIGGGDRVQKAVDEAGETAQQASQTAEQAGVAAGQASSDAAKAKAAADAAQEASKKLETLIRQTSDGLTVGKSADGKTYAGPYVQVGADGTVRIMGKTGATMASFDKDSVSFGESLASQKVRFCGGHGELSYHGSQIWLAGKSVMLVPIDPSGIQGGDRYIGFGPDGTVWVDGGDCAYRIGGGSFSYQDFAKLEKLLSSKPVVLWDHVGLSQDEVRQNAALYRARSYVDSNWHMERFERVLIEYADDDGTMQSMTVTGPFFGQRIALMTGVSLPGTMWLKTKHFTIHNDGIREAKIRDIYAFGDAALPDHGAIVITQGNPIAILRITGYPSL